MNHACNHPIKLNKPKLVAGMCKREAAERKAAARAPCVVERWRTVDENDEAPVWTFRVIVLGCISFLFLLVVNKYFVKETCECVVGMALTIVVVYPLGYTMGKLIPRRILYYPTFGLEFSINDGPFGFKEYAVISIFANLGATIGGLTSSSIDHYYI